MRTHFPLSFLFALLSPAFLMAAATLPVTDGLVVQLDPSTLTGLTDGAAVSSWSGKNAAGETITFTQSNAANKPTYKSSVSSLGGSAALYFDGDYLQYGNTFGITGAQGRTIFAVWADATATGQNYQHVMHMGNGSTDQAYGLSVGRGTTSRVGNHYWNSGFDGSTTRSGANVAAIRYDGTVDGIYLNGYYGGQNTKTNVNTVSGVTLIGSRLQPYAEGIKGSIAEILIYDRDLTTAEIYQVNQYLSEKYSISSGYYTQSAMDYSGAQINIDFESALPSTWGEMITEGCGVLEQTSGNHVYRLIDNTGSLSNQAYNDALNSATGSINGKFDLTFSNAAADGVSLTLAGTNIDVTKKISGSAEYPTTAGSFALGYQIYGKNNVGIYWDSAQIGSINLDSNNVSLKDGNSFTTEFSIDYRPENLGADVTVTLYSTNTGALYGTWTGYVSNLNAFDNKLVLRGRTGGSTANADFDNIQILYQNAVAQESFTWIPGSTGSLTDATKWQGGVAPSENTLMKIESGTNTISANTFNVKDGQTLKMTGGTTNIQGVATVDENSTVIISGSTADFSSNVRVGANASGTEGYVANSGAGLLAIQEGATVNIHRWLSMGYNSDGAVTISGGTLNLDLSSGAGGIVLGDATQGGTSTFTMSGGTVNNAGVTTIGSKGKSVGKFSMTGGTFISKDLITVGNGSTASSLTVSGGSTGGTLKAGKGIVVKSGSTLTLNAPTLVSTNTDGSINGSSITIGSGSNSTDNKIVVEKGATFTTNQNVHLGYQSSDYGALEIKGTATVGGTYFIVGFQGNGDVTVDGGKLTANQVILGDNAGGKPVATLTFKNNATGTINSALQIGDKNTATGTVTVTDSTLTVNGDIKFGNEGGASGGCNKGTLIINGASTVTAKSTLKLGITAASNGYVTVGGTSTFTVAKDTYLGENGTGSLTLEDSAQMTTTGCIMLAHNANTSGTILMTGNSSLTMNSIEGGSTAHLIIGRLGTGSFTMRDNATLNWNGTGVCGLGELGGKGTLNLEGGTFNVNKVPTTYSKFIVYNNSVVNQSGGTMNLGTTDVSVPLELKNGTYNLTGGTLNAAGGITKAGTSTFTLSGTGILSTPSVGFSLTQDGGTLSPGVNWTGEGTSIGTTTINGDYTTNSGSTIYLEIDAEKNQADQIVVTGNALFNEGTQLVLDYNEADLQPGQSFDLVKAKSVTGLAPLLSTLSEKDQYYWLASENGGTFTFSVNANAVPEPAAWLLMLVGIFGLLSIQHKKRIMNNE